MKKSLVALIVVVVVAVVAGAIYFSKSSVPMSTFTHSAGAYTFSYPTGWRVEESGMTVAMAHSASSTQPEVKVTILNYPEVIKEILESKTLTATEVPYKSGFKAWKIGTASTSVVANVYGYILGLDSTDEPQTAIILSGQVQEGGITQQQIDGVFKSMTVDVAKAKVVADALMAQAQLAAKDAQVRASLVQLRPSAEQYFDSNKSSYAGFCKPTGTSAAVKTQQAIVAAIASVTGPESLVCFATKTAYAAAVKLPSGPIFCVDSTGQALNVTNMITGPVCK